ncbi:MAG: zinc ribbon domain-containing protein [Deltaproteobacteria bacterium]|nr:zinc ribbon domain-containing protein [Deltaproteobacteria bacterium]
MPLYEFRCPKCGHEFEQIVFSTDKEPPRCVRCGDSKPERLLSVFSSSARTKGGKAPVLSSCSTPSRGFS